MTRPGARVANGPVNDLRHAGAVARDVSRLTWVARFARLGLVTRGILYFVPGAFALRLALGSHARPMTTASAIDEIGRQPFGRELLLVVAAGLAGYALWGVVRAVFDPLGRGHSPGGLAARAGYAVSAIAYLGLFVATVRMLTGSLAQVEQHTDWSAALLARPFGAIVVAIIGVCWILGAGVTQIVSGWQGSFARDLALERTGPLERRWAIALGRVGTVSRGIVFTIIGVMLVAAARNAPANAGAGLEGALLELARQHFGPLLLGAAGVGLMTFGIYSAMCARWMRMPRPSAGTQASAFDPHAT